jgi:hypothetical protein
VVAHIISSKGKIYLLRKSLFILRFSAKNTADEIKTAKSEIAIYNLKLPRKNPNVK